MHGQEEEGMGDKMKWKWWQYLTHSNPGLFSPAWLLRGVQFHLALGGHSWHKASRLGGWLSGPSQPGGGGELGAPSRGGGPDSEPQDGECGHLLDPACLLAYLPAGSLQAGGLQQREQIPRMLSRCSSCWNWGVYTLGNHLQKLISPNLKCTYKSFMVQNLVYQIEAGLEPGLLYKGEVSI